MVADADLFGVLAQADRLVAHTSMVGPPGVSAEVPLVLRRGNLYATAAILGTTTDFLLEALGVPRAVATLVGMALVAAVRFAAIWWRLQLPEFHVAHTAELPAVAGEEERDG